MNKIYKYSMLCVKGDKYLLLDGSTTCQELDTKDMFESLFYLHTEGWELVGPVVSANGNVVYLLRKDLTPPEPKPIVEYGRLVCIKTNGQYIFYQGYNKELMGPFPDVAFKLLEDKGWKLVTEIQAENPTLIFRNERMISNE